jgi:hypothetical protein
MYGGESARSSALNSVPVFSIARLACATVEIPLIAVLRGRLSANRSARLLTMFVAATSCAEAAQPLVTDDAAVLAPKTCQLEAWVRSAHDGDEYWALPACNLTDNLELTAGAGRARPDAAKPSTILQLQAKTVLFPRVDGASSFGMLIAAGRDIEAPHGRSAFQFYAAKGLASWYPRSDLEVDLNLGAANVFGAGTFAVAGGAIQYAVITNLQLLAEVFRGEPGNGKYQIGARYIIVPNRVEAYASYANRFNGSSERSMVIGVRVQTATFLP